ncbi:hypothetical protein SD71_18845 [Cohnella kolymensis]|uniref:Uncharacterized protein n=1 Tax=Cohnella kolymensis TaxID=1590652 RepID=A0ABR5A0E9_9BACL|nr:hypothetical protein SD71_18845 [Cohnella kolymensis]
MASQVNTAENRCSQELKREVRCKTDAVPPLSMGSNPEAATVASADVNGKARKAMIQEPGNLPVFDKHPITYEE